MTNLIAQIDPIQLVDKASAQSDRWLFLAAIVFIIIAFLIVIRYLVRDRDKEREARAEENKHHQAWVVTVYTENVKLTANVLVVLQENNALLRKLGDHLVRFES